MSSNTKIQLQDLRLDTRYKKLKGLAKTEFKKIQEFINLAKNGENNKGIDISEATERKYIDSFTMAYKSVKKPLTKLTKEDLTKLKHNLKSGKIKSRFNKPYSITSQREMELILIRFLEFVNPTKYSKFRKWFIVRVPKKSVEYLKEQEIEKLYKACKTNEERFIICVLFDGGFRASEFINIRFEDITEPTPSFPYYKILIKEEYSKTKERNIGLYWKHTTEAIKDYLFEIDKSNLKKPVIQKEYDTLRFFLSRLGSRVLGKRVHFHMFRKSSASFYATKLKSRQQLCYRYGWNFSSNVPDVYISREQGEEEVKDHVVNSNVEIVSKENQELKTRMILMEEQMRQLTEGLGYHGDVGHNFAKLKSKLITQEEFDNNIKKLMVAK